MNSDEQRIFLHQILNEILHGFGGDDFEAELGMNREDAKSIWERVRQGAGLSELSTPDIHLLRNTTSLTVRELEDGVNEFQTRTGFTLSQSQKMIDLLNSCLTGE